MHKAEKLGSEKRSSSSRDNSNVVNEMVWEMESEESKRPIEEGMGMEPG